MNKNRITVDNPQGVEYPDAVTVDGKLVHACNLEKTEGVKYYFPGCEGDEEEEMSFSQRKNKNGVTKFFKHKPGYLGDRNEPDRYLHNYAELRLKQRFDESKEFSVQYYVKEECPVFSTCQLKTKLTCGGAPKLVLKKIDLKGMYDKCTPEKKEDKYIADLLLTNSQDENVKPLFLEVLVTHKCSDEKIESGHQIIEIGINQKEDAGNAIIENAGQMMEEYLFMQSENKKDLPPIKFYGFNRDVPFNNHVNFANFLLTKKENELIADCRAIPCKDVEKYAPENRAFSLSIPLKELKSADIYEVGMAKAQSMGLKVRDCSICGRYKIPTRQSDRIDSQSCRLIHSVLSIKDNEGREQQIRAPYLCQMPYRCNGFDKSKQANGCKRYQIDRQRIDNLVREIAQMNPLLWVDESLLPPKPQPRNKPRPIEKPMPAEVHMPAKSIEPTEHQEEEYQPINPKVYEDGYKKLSIEDCLNCPIHRNKCDHCKGHEDTGDQHYVICDYKRHQ